MQDTVSTTDILTFKKIEEKDMPVINSLIQGCYSRTCDYTFGGILMWAEYFNYEFCVVDNTLYIKGLTENNRSETAFMLPIGAKTTGEAVSLILDYCKAHGIKPVFSAVPEDRMEVLLDEMADAEIEPLDDWTDYLYDIQALATLSGKALSKKRNHFNQFVNNNPGWRLETLTSDRLEEVKAFFGTVGKEATESAHCEYEECLRVLDNYADYPFEGAILRGRDGSIAAAAIGEVVGDTLFVHIEKMNHGVDGAGAAICRLYAEYMLHRHPGLRFENREEDCGDEGLRNAKMQYHPLALLRKYNVRIKN